uniref:transposase n=1 Tax=Methylobacter luteus TaxID=415 RepID=UPI000410C6AD|nr:transposase [Methylobacter luteus]
MADSVLEKVIEWRTRPLDTLHPILYPDCIIVKIRLDKRVINKAAQALSVNLYGPIMRNSFAFVSWKDRKLAVQTDFSARQARQRHLNPKQKRVLKSYRIASLHHIA